MVLKPLAEVYPNPATEYFDVQLVNQSHYLLDLYDFSGRVVYSNKLNSNFIRINVLSFAKGMYVLNVKDLNSQESSSYKVLVN